MTSPILSVTNVSKSFKAPGRGDNRLFALRNLSFDVAEGEFVSILGPSGCGKTTCLRMLAGLATYDGGSVTVRGTQVRGPGYERAMVFQSFNLFPWKTIIQNVEFGLKMRHVARAERVVKAEAALELVGLRKFSGHYPHQLSGGMQQRVGLARALATDAEILLMDEPFGAIDAQTRELLQGELLKILDRIGKTVVFITHSVDEAIYLSDRVLVFSAGPGRVMAEYAIDLPKPRWQTQVHKHPHYEEYREAIWESLRLGMQPQAHENHADQVSAAA
jgi:ABC-type nitrate/sulfonate/bicarbonate transport system ATPase subunit